MDQVSRRQPKLAPGSIRIALYFADSQVNLYQVRQWYAPLAALAKTWPAVIIARAPGSALALVAESPVPVKYARTVIELEEFIAEQDLHVVLYVNQNAKNFQMFRYGRMWHVFINHGESDKMYMTTNQFKAYDYSLVAGEAARDRLRRKIWNFDVEGRTLMIGRPQADHLTGALPFTPDDRTVVLYSPTWEGDRDAAAYGSVRTHGVALTAALLASGAHRLIYRPHPRTGVLDPETRRANQEIIAAISAANTKDPSAQHVFDDGPELGWQLAAADVAITDVSAMVYDRLATGKPLVVTRPVSADAEIDSDGYLGQAEWLAASDAPDVVAIVDRALHDKDALDRLGYWVDRHFGDTTPGAATARCEAAIRQLMMDWDRFAAQHADDPMSRDLGDDDESESDD
ncbi:MAG: CDP-glycerol glycerophosphotransferase family protein [Actinomycetota bacterium]